VGGRRTPWIVGGMALLAAGGVGAAAAIALIPGAPVAGLDASAFEVQEDGRPLSPLESQRAVAPKGQQVRVASLLLLDLSGSVLRTGDFTALKEAATRYVKTVLGPRDAGQRLAIYSFDGREVPQRLAAFTADQATALAALEGLDVKECASNLDCAGFVDHRTCAGWRCVDDSTNLNGAIVKALDTLDDQLALEPEVRWKEAALVVFTDGTDQASRVSHGELLSRLDRSKVRRFTVGLGAEIEEKSLTAIGVDGSWPVAKASGLSDAFAAVAAKRKIASWTACASPGGEAMISGVRASSMSTLSASSTRANQ
jgi:hypothetical protein